MSRRIIAITCVAFSVLTACGKPPAKTADGILPTDLPTVALPSPVDCLVSPLPTVEGILPTAFPTSDVPATLDCLKSLLPIDVPKQTWGSVSGTVTETNEDPVVGLCVMVLAVKVKPPGPPELRSDNRPGAGYPWDAPCAMTDERGHYRMYPLAAGVYRVAFAMRETGVLIDPVLHSYGDELTGGDRWVPEWFDNRTSGEQPSGVNVELGKETANIDATLVVGGSITGRITGSDGVDLEGACAVLRRAPAAGKGWTTVQAATTDARGNYRLQGLPAGTYKLTFWDMCTVRVPVLQSRPDYKTKYYPNTEDVDEAGDLTMSLGQRMTSVNAVLTAPKWADLSVERITVGPVVGVGLSKTKITAHIANLGERRWDMYNPPASMRFWAVSPRGDYFYVKPQNPDVTGSARVVDPIEPGQHQNIEVEWTGSGSIKGWSIVAVICIWEPPWDKSLLNNVGKVRADTGASMTPPSYENRCGNYPGPPENR